MNFYCPKISTWLWKKVLSFQNFDVVWIFPIIFCSPECGSLS